MSFSDQLNKLEEKITNSSKEQLQLSKLHSQLYDCERALTYLESNPPYHFKLHKEIIIDGLPISIPCSIEEAKSTLLDYHDTILEKVEKILNPL